MKVLRLWMLLLAVLAGAAARANPVAYGQQLCVMLTSGISQQKAWDYIVREHSKTAMANSQTVIPWYSAASAGWAVGTALGNAEAAHKELDAMKTDVFKVARTTCPQQFR
jgi:hypothetical protein